MEVGVGVIRLLVGGVFLYSGVGKLGSLGSVSSAIADTLPMVGAASGPWSNIAAALLVAIEIATPVLLWRRSTLATGAALAGLLGFAFALFHLDPKRSQEACGCFGRFGGLSTVDAFRLNVAILASSLAILAWRFSGNPGALSQAEPGSRPSGHVAAAPGAGRGGSGAVLCSRIFGFFILLPVALSYATLGNRLTAATSAGGAPLPELTPTLRPGQSAPAFELPSSTGEVVKPRHSGRYTLLVFASTRCGTCDPAVKALEAARDRLEPRLAVFVLTPALEGQSAAAVGTSFAAKYAVSLPVAGDPGNAVHWAYCPRPLAWPTAVLIDERGIVQQVVDATRWVTNDVAEAALALAADLPYGAERVHPVLFAHGRRLPEIEVTVGGSRRSLQAVVGSVPTLLLVADPACSKCVESLRRLTAIAAGGDAVPRILLLAPSARAAAELRKLAAGLPGVRMAVAVGAGLASCGLGPNHELLIRDGRIVAAKEAHEPLSDFLRRAPSDAAGAAPGERGS